MARTVRLFSSTTPSTVPSSSRAASARSPAPPRRSARRAARGTHAEVVEDLETVGADVRGAVDADHAAPVVDGATGDDGHASQASTSRAGRPGSARARRRRPGVGRWARWSRRCRRTGRSREGRRDTRSKQASRAPSPARIGRASSTFPPSCKRRRFPAGASSGRRPEHSVSPSRGTLVNEGPAPTSRRRCADRRAAAPISRPRPALPM